MTNQPPTLREIARAILDKHQVSGRTLNRLAEAKGLTLSYTTVNHMASGTYTSRPSDKTLQALQVLSDFPLEDVYAAASRPMPRAGLRERLPEDAEALTGEQEEAVLSVVRQFVQANRRLHTLTTREDVRNDDSSAAMDQAPGSGADSNVRHLRPATDDELAAAREGGRSAGIVIQATGVEFPEPGDYLEQPELLEAYRQGRDNLTTEDRAQVDVVKRALNDRGGPPSGPSAEALDPTIPDEVAARSQKGKGRAQKERDRQDEEGEQ